MSKSKINSIYNEFKFANGPAQFILYGIWTVIVSGLFPLSGYLPTLTLIWMLSGVAVIVTALTLDRKLVRRAILSSISLGVVVGSIFITYAATGATDLRADMQTVTIALITLVIWGFYLGNLCSRQLWDKGKVKQQ